MISPLGKGGRRMKREEDTSPLEDFFLLVTAPRKNKLHMEQIMSGL